MKTGQANRVRKLWLKSRKIVKLPPKPEEQLGLVNFDPVDGRDRIKVAQDGPVKPINLRQLYPFVIRNQERTNRCGGFSGSYFLEMLSQKLWKESGMDLEPYPYSANDLYWFARGDTSLDSGVYMRDLMKAMTEHGATINTVWPDRESCLTRPEGLGKPFMEGGYSRFTISGYERIPLNGWRDSLKRVFSVERLPVLFGVELFRTAAGNANRNGFLPIPDKGDIPIGGHAMLGCGWMQAWGKDWIIAPNSWGTGIGDGGVWYIDFDYFEQMLIRDLWTVPKAYY